MMIKFFSFVVFYCGFLSFSMNRKHLLLMLLSLEYMILSLFMIIFIYLSFLSNDFFFSMIFLTFTVCEGVLGLSLLVSLIRFHGNDYFHSFNLLW